MLIIKNLTIKNAKGSILLDDFSLTLSSHDKAAIIGEEGNGKSTLLKAVYDQSLIDEYASVSGVIQKNNEFGKAVRPIKIGSFNAVIAAIN